MDKIVESDSEDDLPGGWEERVTTDGKVYYAKYDCITSLAIFFFCWLIMLNNIFQ